MKIIPTIMMMNNKKTFHEEKKEESPKNNNKTNNIYRKKNLIKILDALLLSTFVFTWTFYGLNNFCTIGEFIYFMFCTAGIILMSSILMVIDPSLFRVANSTGTLFILINHYISILKKIN